MAEFASTFVGRVPELEEFERALGRLRDGRGSAVAVLGEPGIGKSRLLAEVVARTNQHEVVLTGSASEYERGLPFGPFVDALDEYVQGVGPPLTDELDVEVVGRLAQILPSWPSKLQTATDTGQDPLPVDERFRAHRAVQVLLERLAGRNPLMLVLDDLHWSDSASVGLIAGLLRRPPRGPILLVLGARPRQAPELLLAAVERASRQGDLARLALGPLTVEEADRLVAESITSSANWLYSTSGGNPFYLEQLARGFRRAGLRPSPRPDLQWTLFDSTDVPEAVSAALWEEIVLLPGDTRRILEGAAVAGDPFEPELAAAASGQPLAAVMTALDDLLDRDLIRPTDIPRRFRFRHPLVRRAIYEAAPAAWRLGAHARCADALAARGASVLMIAAHVEHSGRPGDRKAISILSEAGRMAFQHAPAEAARLFAAALRLLPSAAPDSQRVRLLIELTHAHKADAQIAGAYETIRQALELLADGDANARVQVVAECAELEQLLGLHRQAHDRLRRMLSQLPDKATPSTVSVMVQLAVVGLYGMDYAAMHHWARRAVDGVRHLDDPPLRVSTASMLALAAVLDGLVDEAREVSDETAAIADALTDQELARCPDNFANLAVAELYLDRCSEAARHAERAWAIAKATGRDRVLPLLYWLSTVRAGCGHPRRAAEISDMAVEVARASHHTQGLAWNLSARSVAAAAVGDLPLALATAEEAVVAAAEGELRLPSVIAGVAFSAARLLAGEPDGSVRVLLDLGGGDDLSYLPLRWKPAGYELLTRGLLALDRHGEAATAASRAVRCARRLGLASVTALADRAATAVALAHGDPQPSARRAGTGADDGALLTDRELEVAQLMSQGKTNRQIAAELFVSRKTIETHLHHVFGKLGVATRTQAAKVLLQRQSGRSLE